MNIFYLHADPVTAAQMQCDKHVVKMILESAQLLSTAHRVLDGDEYADSVGLYKTAHKNHPSAVWARASVHNYAWLYDHMIGLMREYTSRYAKQHASERLVSPLSKPPANTPAADFSEPPQCMPDHCKTSDTISAYRRYYVMEKSSFAKWKNSQVPDWFSDGLHSLL